MKILILTFYYPPDLCAGSFRAGAFVDALLAKLPPESQVTLITTLPNRYSSFSAEAPELEQKGPLTVHRIKLPPHSSGMRDQARSFISFARGVLKCTQGEDFDLVFATSSRLMTALLGSLLSRTKGAPLYLDIRDIFADTMKEVLPPLVSRPVFPILSLIERWVMRRASRINLVSRGFSNYFQLRYPQVPYSFFTNGIDEEFVSIPFHGERERESNKLTVLYAGNIGEGQGLHLIIPRLALILQDKVEFRIIGDGGRRAVLESAIREMECQNVQLLPPMKREALIREYLGADVLFLHLNDYEAFRKVLPSKIFEYAAVGKPIWGGLSGHAADFLTSEVSNTAIFHPCDVEAAVKAFSTLRFERTPRDGFVKKYLRKNIMSGMAEDVILIKRRN